ncbi:hypothetical protein KJ865_09515 [Myxococcota bacterium]|nr:hypothetical protein [Myxococcota bacterium]
MERSVLLFPGTRKTIVITTAKYLEKVDIGIDFDLPADALDLKIVTGGHTYRGRRMAGTFMPLVVCGVPTGKGRLVLHLRQRSLAKSAWVAIRVAPSLSKMCAPTTPIWDDYVVRR